MPPPSLPLLLMCSILGLSHHCWYCWCCCAQLLLYLSRNKGHVATVATFNSAATVVLNGRAQTLSLCSTPPLHVTQRGACNHAAASITTAAMLDKRAQLPLLCSAPPLPITQRGGMQPHRHRHSSSPNLSLWWAWKTTNNPLSSVLPPFFLPFSDCLDHCMCASSAACKLVMCDHFGPATPSLELSRHPPPPYAKGLPLFSYQAS